MSEDILGIATCGNCQKRFRILKKHARIVGKEIQCPKCHRQFVVSVQSLTPLEQAAVDQAAAESNAPSATQSKARQRRKKNEIREEHYSQIRTNLPGYLQRLRAIASQESSSEEQIRIWCIDVLRSALGYDDADIDTEMTALGQRIDIAIKHDGRVLMVIECKNIRNRLASSTRDQVVNYASSKSADWAVITNGQIWKLFRIIPVKGHDPQVIQVFDVALFDDDGLSEYDVQCLYLLTKRALIKNDSDREFHLQQSITDRRMLDAITHEKAISVLRRLLAEAYRNEFDIRVKLDDEMVKERLEQLFRPESL